MKKRLTPLRAIRAKCLDCCGDSPKEVALCPVSTCVLHLWRFGVTPEGASMSSLKTIRSKCVFDCGEFGSKQEVRMCPMKDCALFPHRMGKRAVSDEFRQKCRERAKQKGTFSRTSTD